MKNINQINEQVKIQISAGQGPIECAWIVAQVAQIILCESRMQKISATIVESLAFDKLLRHQNLIEVTEFKSVLIHLEGVGASEFSKGWLGVIRWRGRSPYRPKHKRLNWHVKVDVISSSDCVPPGIDDIYKDLKIETMRSSGPGGQHVNKTSSAVRVIHLPSQVVVREESSRSQHVNKHTAVKRIQAILIAMQTEKCQRELKERWDQHRNIRCESPRKIFEGLDFTLAK